MTRKITTKKTNRIINRLKHKIQLKNKTKWDKELKKLQNQPIDDIQINEIDAETKITSYLLHTTNQIKPITYQQEEKTQPNIPAEPIKTPVENNTIQTKSGPRAVRQCKYNPPPPENTNITELTNAIQTLLEYIKNTKDKLNQMSESIHNCNLETSDLLHEIEFSNLNETEQKEEYQKIKEVRERRRTYKKMQSYMEILNCFIDITPNIYNKLDTLLYKLKEQQKRHETALFSPRIRTDVKENERIRYLTQIKGEKT